MTLCEIILDIALAAYLSDHPHAQIGKLIRENKNSLLPEDRRLANKLYAMRPKKRVEWVRCELVPRILELGLN